MLIGIIGTKRSGKDTTARIIQAVDLYRTYFKDLKLVDENTFIHNCLSDKYFQELKERNYISKYDNHAFADNVKMCISIITGIDYKELFVEEIKNSDSGIGEVLTYRQLMQQFGTEVGRTLDPDIWIKSLFKDYDSSMNWIITDVRFENEANTIIRNGGILFRIIKEEPSNEHSSETGLPNYPSIAEEIYNKGSMDELINKIKLIMERYKI